MDPTWISPPPPPPPPPPAPPSISATVPFTLEANNHMPSFPDNPNPNENPNPNHPSYDEMINAAIGALKEKDGSSKRAIGKYIEQTYKDLPPTHTALLTHHLNRLKASGHLLMVKKSYKLPGSPSSQPSSPQTQRPRGRPPKPKLPIQPQSQPTEPVWAALGLSDDPAAQSAKRGPGRPRKIGALPVGSPVPGRRGRPPGSGRSKLPKRPGRPPKPKSVTAISNGLKRRPGRPPKIQSNLTVIPFAAPVASVAADLPSVPPAISSTSVPNGSPRPRGRPRKNAAAVEVTALTTVGVAPRGRGRGRKVLPGMRQGRPQKLAVGRPKNPAARPVGRPKGATGAITAQKAAIEELRIKLEHFQSKVKESLAVLKPYFNHESPVTAIAAIQDLEVLSTLDLKAPLGDESQQLQQFPHQQQQLPPQPLPPQQLPQTQMYEQQYPQISTQPQLQQFFQLQSSAPS